MDSSRTKALIDGVVGVGPKVIESWRNAIMSSPEMGKEFSSEGQDLTVNEDVAFALKD